MQHLHPGHVLHYIGYMSTGEYSKSKLSVTYPQLLQVLDVYFHKFDKNSISSDNTLNQILLKVIILWKLLIIDLSSFNVHGCKVVT